MPLSCWLLFSVMEIGDDVRSSPGGRGKRKGLAAGVSWDNGTLIFSTSAP